MNEIVVLSGKGGTGKTSIMAALSVLAGERAISADCDVDASNLFLLLKPDFNKNIEFYSGELAQINQDLCIRCGKCKEICRFNAISLLNFKFEINSLDCEGCGYCQKVCNAKAINLIKRKSGNIFLSKTRFGNAMVHAKLDIAAENSGKLVAQVKNEAVKLAEQEGLLYIIVDGSPGIGCPVVSSLSGANYVVLVTEPTISGIHDLKRIYSVIEKFRIKAGCVINKFDLNIEQTKQIHLYLKKMNIDLLAEIPYDINFTKSMIEGKTIVEYNSPIKSIIENIWIKINNNINL